MLAFTFPGQGSQRPAMGVAWQGHAAWHRVEEASSATGIDVEHLLLRANADELTQTQNAQLATFVVSIMAFDTAVEAGLAKAELMAGHSLGEYSALVAAGILSFADGCKLVGIRGAAMKAAADQNPGTMYAVLGLDDIKVEAACRQASAEFDGVGAYVANYNSDGQVVISGGQKQLERAGEIAKEMGAKRSVPLPVGGAFHTPHMAPAQNALREALASTNFSDSTVRVVSNFDAAPHDGGEQWRELCAQQLCNPVRWSQSVAAMSAEGATVFAELGPGNVLTNLAKRNAPSAVAVAIAEPNTDDLASAVADLDRATSPGDSVIDLDNSHLDGEQPALVDRVVIAHATGKFALSNETQVGQSIKPGDAVALIDGEAVQSPFGGVLSRILAMEGERVTPGQPVAWIATTEGQ